MTYIRVKYVEKIIDRYRNTILRWELEGQIPHPQKDSRGWRFYTEEDIEKIKQFMALNLPLYLRNPVRNF